MSHHPERLFIRTEASTSLGMGHFMRCFAIAEYARTQGMDVTFLLNEINPAMLMRMRDIGVQSVSLATRIGTKEDLQALRPHIPGKPRLIIDSYKVNAPYLGALASMSTLILMDDVCELNPMPCHFVVNASVAAYDMPYEARAPEAVRLLGPDYAAIRREFRNLEPKDEGFVAVMFGGSDVKGYSLKAARAILEAVEDVEVRIIAGPAMMDLGTLKVLASNEPRVKLLISPPSVAEALNGARIVVTAAGTSVNEIAAIGLMGLVVVVADNQMASMDTCPFPVLDGRISLPDDLGQWVRVFYDDNNTREAMARMAHDIIDGQGCKRILEELNSHRVVAA